MMTKPVGDKMVDPGFLFRSDDPAVMQPTSPAELDIAVAALQANKESWTELHLAERIDILDQILVDLYAVADEWVSASVQAKGTQGNDFAEGEEWAMLAYVFREIRLLGDSLRDIQSTGRPQIPGPVYTHPGGQVRAQVFPQSRYDRLVFPGTTAEVWMLPDKTIDEVLDCQARFYRGDIVDGKVVLVLGAGNASMLVPADFIYKLFVGGSVVILKLNPVNSYLGPILAKGFRELIERNFLRIVYGGAEVGNYLCHHPDVDELHITGADKTYEAIVFGLGKQGAKRKEQRHPFLKKRFTGELGNVTPVIVVPGPWTEEDIAAWGEKLARWLTINAGFNCLTPRVIIQSANWVHRQPLNQAIGTMLAEVELRKAYYPGAKRRHAQFVAAHPTCQQYGETEDNMLPWTFIQDVDVNSTNDICFRNEAFCGLFAETALKAEDIQSFLAAAVDFANETLWGNLTATLIVHPASLQDIQVAAAVDRALTELRYGMVLINQFAGLGYFAKTTTWGAYPGNDIYDIQSGIGVTSNVLMFANPQKSVVRCPFKLAFDPLSLQSRTVLETCRRLADLQYQPSIWKVPGLIWSALRS